MRARRLIHGRVRGHDVPDWAPLEALLGSEDLCGHFMWMFDVEMDDGAVLNAYKHRWTRRYIHLTTDQRTFVYAGRDVYTAVEPADAIEAAFERWECCGPTTVERLALRSAIARARRMPPSNGGRHREAP